MKMVLVDDEKAIVEGIKYIINRYLPECTVVGVAYNGLEGVKVIQRCKPDIVITDIRMPQADGLDMIKMLKEKGSQAKFILLSGYTEFEYARRGLNLGVLSYINKPVEEEELQASIYQAMQTIREEKSKVREVDDLKQKIHSRMQERALREIFDIGSEYTKIMEESLEMAKFQTENSWFVSVLLELSGHQDAFKESDLQHVYVEVDLALDQYRDVYRFRYSATQIVIVVSQGSPIGYADLVRSLRLLKEKIDQQLELIVTVGVGTVQKLASGISQSFEEARYALSYKVVKGANVIIAYPEVMNLSGRSVTVPEDILVKLEAALDNMDEKECIELIHEIFRMLEAESDMNPSDLQLQCLNILLSSIKKMSFQQLQQNDFLGKHILSLEGMSRFRTLESLEEWMVNVIRRMIQFKLEHHIPKKKDIIAEVKEYVTANYNKPITLADLSARFFISPYYLSQYFKQKTGETYVHFLTKIRIGKAKELLEKSDLKVYEICQLVGYTDTQHFARMFEKLVGCKPRDYRKSLPEV